jgi:hypothetical protein
MLKEPNAQIYIETARNGCHRKAGRVIHTVERQGVPLVYVLERQERVGMRRSQRHGERARGCSGPRKTAEARRFQPVRCSSVL